MKQVRQKVCVLMLVCLALLSSGSAVAQTERTDKEYEVGAALWMQSSGEKRALAYQAFLLARIMLDRDFSSNRRSRMKRAVIVDVDETVLDNSRHEGWSIRNHRGFNPQDWTAWCNRAEAEAVSGAVEFLRYAHSRGVKVFYITNRRETEKDGTARNLMRLGFPNVSDETLLVRTDNQVSSKEPRRQSVAAKHRIVLLIGDDLNDFAEVFEKGKTPEARIAAVEQNRARFGTRFIVLPNPMYGNWENAIYGEARLTDEQKVAKRRSALKQ